MGTDGYGGMRLGIMSGREGARKISVSMRPAGFSDANLRTYPYKSVLIRISPGGAGACPRQLRRGVRRAARGTGGNFPRVRQAAFTVFCVASPQKRGDRTKKRKRILEPSDTHAGSANTPEPWCRAFALPRGFARGARSPTCKKAPAPPPPARTLPKAPGIHRRRRRRQGHREGASRR